MNKIIIFIVLNLFCTVIFAQMPGWMTVTDSDGNTFYIDGALKIKADNNPQYDYKAVSQDGIGYYFYHASELYENYHKSQALGILKSILVLSDKQPGIRKYSIKAVEEIQKIKKKEGTRFSELDIMSSIILYRIEKKYYFNHSFSGLSFSSEGEIKVLNKKYYRRGPYSRDGILIAVLNQDGSNKMLISLTSELFHYRLKSIDDYIEIVKNKVPSPEKGNDVIRNENCYIRLTNYDNDNSSFTGHESYMIKGRYGVFARTIYLSDSGGQNQAESLRILNELCEN